MSAQPTYGVYAVKVSGKINSFTEKIIYPAIQKGRRKGQGAPGTCNSWDI